MNYNTEEISEKFQEGRRLLDSGYYIESIEIFTELIDETNPLKDENSDALLTWNVSLNNRGVARCKLGYCTGNKPLYEEGLRDFKTTVDNQKNEDRKNRMTAQANLKYGLEEIKSFDTSRGANFRFDNLS